MALSASDITPTVDEIAGHLKSRTFAGGQQVGTFNADTTPTADEAAEAAAVAARYVALELGKPYTTWDGDLLASARDCAAIYAALDIENSYFNDGNDGGAKADQLGRMAREQLATLGETARNNQVGGARLHSIPIRRVDRRRPPPAQGTFDA